MKKLLPSLILLLLITVDARAAGHWADVTTAAVSSRYGTAKYMTWSPVRADATGTVSRLRVRIAEYGGPTEIGLALYRSDGTWLTGGKATVIAAGYREIPVPPVPVVQGQSYFIGAQAASDMLYTFSCGATSGGWEGANSYTSGLPLHLPLFPWEDSLLTAGIYIEGGPQAEFTATPVSGISPLTVAFTDSSTGNITSRLWDFGDGTRSSDQNPTHLYASPGIYSVSLTVDGPDGSTTATRADYVRVAAPIPPGSNVYRVQIDPAAHQKFGLFYPATYRFRYAPGLTGLTAQYRFGPDDWTPLPEKRSLDLFNGIEAARFDATEGLAWLSVGFSRLSDEIYLRIVDDGGKPVDIQFDTVTPYYDDRKAVVTITLDDWTAEFDDSFRTASDYLAATGLYFSVGVELFEPPFASIQEKINQHGRQMEIASHSVYHSCDTSTYKGHGYETETTGSRDLLRNNLTFPGHPFVPLYLEPCGFSDNQLQQYIAAADYLVSRTVDAGTGFVPWDPALGFYPRAGLSYEWDGDDTQDILNTADGLFLQEYGRGGIYHIMNHPWMGRNWKEGSFLFQHLQFISRRTDVWYVPFGQLYLYRFLAEGRGNLTVSLYKPSPVDFSATPLTGTAPLTVLFSDLSTGAVTGWSWDFGDGTASPLQNPSHTYDTVGTYTVSLTVTIDGGSMTTTKPAYVRVNPPPPQAGFTAHPLSGVVPLSVTFTDTSTGVITGWLWDFGDGTSSTLRDPVHAYTATGTYTVKLTVTGPGGSGIVSQEALIQAIPPPPVAGFTAKPLTGTAPLTVTFTDSSTGVITGWFWDFGDGTLSTLRNPVHVYATGGVYDVQLTVTGPGGAGSMTRTSYIHAAYKAPAANFTATPLSGTRPLSVAFTDTSTGLITAWLWNFGDGTTSTLQNPEHVYATTGNFTVKLKVTGPGGSTTKSRSSYIRVR